MTLLLSVTNTKEIVVGADSLVFSGSEEVYHTHETTKLRLFNEAHWIIGFAGLGDVAANVLDYIDAKGQAFNPDIRIGMLECTSYMGEIYKEFRLNTKARVLLAGYTGQKPRIYRWNLAEPNPEGGEIPPWQAIGAGADLALHFARNCQPLETLNTEQLISLVYFSVAEIAESDPRVRKPIDIGIVRPDGAEILSRNSLSTHEEKSRQLARLIRENL
jgi:20S proteasome alpha/beta subunit